MGSNPMPSTKLLLNQNSLRHRNGLLSIRLGSNWQQNPRDRLFLGGVLPVGFAHTEVIEHGFRAQEPWRERHGPTFLRRSSPPWPNARRITVVFNRS